MSGTARELKPIAEQVLAFVAWARSRQGVRTEDITEDDLRRIELCAQMTIEASLFNYLYGEVEDENPDPAWTA